MKHAVVTVHNSDKSPSGLFSAYMYVSWGHKIKALVDVSRPDNSSLTF